MVKIEAIKALQTNYIWAIIDAAGRRCVIVDPGEAAPVEHFLAAHRLDLSALLITHHHWDHTDGISELVAQRPDLPVYGPRRSHIAGVTRPLVENDRVNLAEFGLALDVLEVPGHTLDHIAYHGGGILLIGDTLFSAGCGRMFEGTPPLFQDSLDKITRLPDATQIYCAHEYTLDNLAFARQVEPDNDDIRIKIERCRALRRQDLPTVPGRLDEERRVNPFLRTRIATVRYAAEQDAGSPLPNAAAVFAALRKWKDGFKAPKNSVVA